MSGLDDLNVIVLRAIRDKDPLVDAISARGGRVHLLPVQKIVPLADDDAIIKAQIARIDSFQKAIFVSSNAASLALRWLGRCALRLRSKGQSFAIGPTSAAVLENSGVATEFPVNRWNSEGLLALPAMTDVRGQSIIIFRGQGGLPVLGEQLFERGALVEYCELYQRRQDDTFKHQIIELLAATQPCVLVAHSGAVLDALIAIMGGHGGLHRRLICRSAVIVPGLRLENYAQQLGFKEVIVGVSALSVDIEHGLLGWYTRKEKNNQ